MNQKRARVVPKNKHEEEDTRRGQEGMDTEGPGPWQVVNNAAYQPIIFDLSGLKGISAQTIELHLKLYAGYVNATNLLSEKISALLSNGNVHQKKMPEYLGLKRCLGFENNGMVLHEYYFGNLKRDGSGTPKADSLFYKKATVSFGSFEVWKEDFISTGKMRGVGWVVCYEDPSSGRLSNHWITHHEGSPIVGYQPLLVMDMWEHAYLLDYNPLEKEKYIEAFFANVNWVGVEKRLSPPSLCAIFI